VDTVLALVLATIVWAFAGSARAAFPGANGHIVFASQRQDRQYEIYSIRTDGSDRRSIALGENPKYSRGGTRIAFIRKRDVWVMNFDGTGQRNLTANAAAEVNPSWSPDDRKIAFAKRVAGKFDIFVMSLDGKQPAVNLTRTSNADDRGAAWSPDGKQIAYERDGQIRVMSVDGKTSRTLTTRGTNVSPAWVTQWHADRIRGEDRRCGQLGDLRDVGERFEREAAHNSSGHRP